MDIKVRDLRQTETIENENKLMVLVDDDLNLVKNITKEEFLTNVISSTENNALVQEQDGNLYVNTSEIADSVQALDDKFTEQIGDLSDLTTEDKTNLVAAINEAATKGGGGSTLLEFKWCDHLLNNISWLRADTFSWQSGDVYVTAYNHLVADIDGITAETETIGSYTVTFYRADDGHKIVLADQESAVLNIYNSTGMAWYYILDTTNTQFKLPRTKYGFEGLRTDVGDMIAESLPNIKGSFGQLDAYGYGSVAIRTLSGAFASQQMEAQTHGLSPNSASHTETTIASFNASRSSSTYQDNAPVQERATQMYLYFYVGDYTQSAIEQTAGLNAELFNGKADINLNNVPASKGILTESYVNGTSWYRVYSDGWCEQGGYSTVGSTSVSLLKAYSNTDYNISLIQSTGGGTPVYASPYKGRATATSFYVTVYRGGNADVWWETCGYIN